MTPKHLGARIGLTAVLHTWGSALTHHPHVHVIVPGGGLSADGFRWIACKSGFFPYHVVMGVTDDRIDPATLWVQEGRLLRGANFHSARPFDAADYLLFGLEKIDGRETGIPSVEQAWSATIANALSDKRVLARARSAFEEVVLASPDLIPIDKRRLIFAMKDELEQYRARQDSLGFEGTDKSLACALARRRQFEREVGIEDREFSQEEIDALDWN